MFNHNHTAPFLQLEWFDLELEYNNKSPQNNIGMYTDESSQPTLEIPNNNLDIKF